MAFESKRTENQRKYRIRHYLREGTDSIGREWKKEFLAMVYALTRGSKSKLEKYLLAYIGDADRVRVISIADMLIIVDLLNRYRSPDEQLELPDMYHPDIRDEELAPYYESLQKDVV